MFRRILYLSLLSSWCVVMFYIHHCFANVGLQVVRIKGCEPHKYFWKDERPAEFYACLSTEGRAMRMRCGKRKYMCVNQQVKTFAPCACRVPHSKKKPSQNYHSSKSDINLQKQTINGHSLANYRNHGNLVVNVNDQKSSQKTVHRSRKPTYKNAYKEISGKNRNTTRKMFQQKKHAGLHTDTKLRGRARSALDQRYGRWSNVDSTIRQRIFSGKLAGLGLERIYGKQAREQDQTHESTLLNKTTSIKDDRAEAILLQLEKTRPQQHVAKSQKQETLATQSVDLEVTTTSTAVAVPETSTSPITTESVPSPTITRNADKVAVVTPPTTSTKATGRTTTTSIHQFIKLGTPAIIVKSDIFSTTPESNFMHSSRTGTDSSVFDQGGNHASDGSIEKGRGHTSMATKKNSIEQLQREPAQVFYSMRAAGCPDLYMKHTDTHMFEGAARPQYVSLILCQAACLRQHNCLGVDWNKMADTPPEERCYFIYPRSMRYGMHGFPDTCCNHYRRTNCAATKEPPTGLSRGESLNAPALVTSTTQKSTTTIPDSGCPYSLHGMPGTSHPFGVNVTQGEVNDEVEECKYWCLVRSFCKAVDFSLTTSTCYYVPEVKEALVTQVTGVTHYRKVICAPPLSCWSTIITKATEDNLSVTNSDTEQHHCTGYCYVKQHVVGNITELERGCDQTVSRDVTNVGCKRDSRDQSVTCYCDTSRCNGLSADALSSQILHMPLDGDLEDHSGGDRHGTVPPDFYPPRYTCLDKVLNCSALFIGQHCITVQSLVGIRLGEMMESAASENKQQVSFAVWFKRITASSKANIQGIFGNSLSGTTPSWQIIAHDRHNYIGAGVVTEGVSFKSISDYNYMTAVDDEWHLVVMTYSGQRNVTAGQFSLLKVYIDGEQQTGNAQADAGEIEARDEPVTIGCVTDKGFIGSIDEVRVFTSVLSPDDVTALMTIRDSSHLTPGD